MCRLILIALFLWVLVLSALVAVAVVYGPWWAVPLVVVGYFLLTGVAVKTLFKTLMMLPFKAKGAALRGATAEVHGVERTDKRAEKEPTVEEVPSPPALEAAEAAEEEPEEDAALEEEDAGVKRKEETLEYVWVDVTITPKANAQGLFKLWEATELMLVPADKGMRRPQEIDEGVSALRAMVWDGTKWGPDDPGKYEGKQRVRLLFALPPEMERRAKFQYYFEIFGEVTLPRNLVVG